MEILIKSFNRPYYLDKCLFSIYKYVSDFSKIVVLDDGTPEKYLSKIKIKYPEIEIVKSELASKKQFQIQNESKIDTEIPVRLWLNAAKNSTEHFVLLEDDMWFVKPIALENLTEDLKKNSIEMVKLFWLNNPILIANNSETINSQIEVYQPEIKIKNAFFYDIVFHSQIPKLKGVFKLFGIFSEEKELQYYQLYNVAGAIFSKQYFESLWQENQSEVNESNQIINALKFFSKFPKSKVSKTRSEVLKTGFATSALQKDFVKDFNIEKGNLVLNKIWFEDKLDDITKSNSDINITSLKHEIIINSDEIFYENWMLWIQKFKKQYTSFGCKIDE